MTPELWQRLKPLYHAAMELPEAARARFAAEACGDDVEMRAELARLLRGGMTSSDNSTAMGEPGGAYPARAGAFVVGAVILGRFKIVRHLGSGGMGDVYEATDLELGRIALKTISANIAGSPEMLARFKREVQLARKVSGPHVCRIHELFVAPDGAAGTHPAFLTMEFLEGVTLADKIIQSGALPWREVRAIAGEICEGLQTIHEAGVIHRDLKCRNIMLAKRNGRSCAVLMDFGLASEAARGTDGAEGSVTSSGAIIGTPNYMAPEQFAGEPLSPGTDVYALGVVLYEMLTGKQPFAASTPLAAAVQRGRRLKPVSSTQPRLPREWDAIICKCLEFKAEDRYRSAAELKAELERLHPDGVRRLFAPFASLLRRVGKISPLRLAVSALSVAVLVAGVVYAVWRFYPRKEPFASISIGQIADSEDVEDVAWFPDGRTLAEERVAEGQFSLWVRNVPTNADTQVLAPTPLLYSGLTVSPDGNQIYFVRQDAKDSRFSNLYALSVLGGAPRQLIRDVGGPVSFSPDGKKIVYMRMSKPATGGSPFELHLADRDGGSDEVLVQSSKDWASPQRSGFVSYSPDGSELAWLEAKSGTSDVFLTLMHLRSRRLDRIPLPKDLFFVGVKLAWLADGQHLLLNALFREGNGEVRFQFAVVAVPSGAFRRIINDTANYFPLALSADAHTLATVSDRVRTRIDFYRVSDGVTISSKSMGQWADDLSWADDGHLVFLRGGKITVMDRASGAMNAMELGKLYVGDFARCSGDQLVFEAFPNVAGGGVHEQLYRVRADGSDLASLAGTEGASGPHCAKNGRDVFYTVRGSDDGNASEWVVSLEGGSPKKVVDLPERTYPIYSSDGRITAWTSRSGGHSAAFIKYRDSRQAARELSLKDISEGFSDSPLNFSPDDKAVVYVQNVRGDFSLVSQPIDGSRSHVVIRVVGREPILDFAWSPSGRELAVLCSTGSPALTLITDTTTKAKE